MSKITKIITGVLAFATIHAAQATVIPTVDGFVPLQYTKNLSIADFLAGVGGWSQNYHLASEYEIADLLATFQIAPHDSRPFTHAEYNFIYEIGGHTLGPTGTYFSDGNVAAIGRSYDTYVSVGISNGDSAQPYESCPSFNACTSPTIRLEPQSLTYKDNQSGLFLVEGTVPEPGSITLMALGLTAFFLRRRAK